jgi:hypothetical protein
MMGALAAWSRGIVSACHRGDWSYGSGDRIPPGYRAVVFIFKKIMNDGVMFYLFVLYVGMYIDLYVLFERN